jgi:hypothetical protein
LLRQEQTVTQTWQFPQDVTEMVQELCMDRETSAEELSFIGDFFALLAMLDYSLEEWQAAFTATSQAGGAEG